MLHISQDKKCDELVYIKISFYLCACFCTYLQNENENDARETISYDNNENLEIRLHSSIN